MEAQPLSTTVALHEQQLQRIVSDIESEKGTRARVNEGIMTELKEIRTDQQKTNKVVWMGLGIVIAINGCLNIGLAVFFRR